ncbi:hypothetical protein J3A83DRAFT_2638568 [Scleroderma citrinum]
MSDTGRQSTLNKAQATLQPESQKSTTEQFRDKAKDIYESTAAKVQPESEKSTFQKGADTVSGDTGKDTGPLADRAKQALHVDRDRGQ